MDNLIIQNSQLVQAVINSSAPAYGQTYYFEDIPNISTGNIKLWGIEAYTDTQAAKSPDGLTVIANADAKNLAVTLVTTQDNFKQVENQPYYNFIRSNNGGLMVSLAGIQVQLTKCYIRLLGAGTLAQDQTALFNLYYTTINPIVKRL